MCGSFHQGYPKFGETAGVQCTSNTLFALCWAGIKRATIWSSWGLDYILERGDQLYKSLNTQSLLSVLDLPCNLEIERHTVIVERLEYEINTHNNLHLSHSTTASTCLIFIIIIFFFS